MTLEETIKNLESLGTQETNSENRLHDAVRVVSKLIKEIEPPYVLLPRCYEVRRVHHRGFKSVKHFLVQADADYWIDGTGLEEAAECDNGEHLDIIPNQTRAGSLLFAHDVQNGLLDEIAAFLK